MTYTGANRRSKLPGRRDYDGTCMFHTMACDKVENLADSLNATVSWRVFAATLSAILVISLAYIGWADRQHNNAYRKAEDAIERTHDNRESISGLNITQKAILRNLQKLMYSSGINPEITVKELEKEIRENGKDN